MNTFPTFIAAILLISGCNPSPEFTNPVESEPELLSEIVTSDHTLSPWPDFTADGIEPLSNAPQVLFTTRYGDEVHVTVKNNGKTTLQYLSGGPSQVQRFQEIQESGQWKQGLWEWCGMGMELYDIEPNQSVVLAVQFWNAERRERILAWFSEKGTNREGLVVLATEEEEKTP